VEHSELYLAAWIPRPGASVLDADTLVPPELQRTMAESLDAEIVEIATGHGPFREQPQRLAELLVAATC
jgi:pimeloyl-ACP methyl ester carboxylesterase